MTLHASSKDKKNPCLKCGSYDTRARDWDATWCAQCGFFWGYDKEGIE